MDTKLKIEPGKFYRTRDGRKAWVGCDLRDSGGLNKSIIHTFVGALSGSLSTWTEDGAFFFGDHKPGDLISEWGEPKQIRGWVNIYHSNLIVWHRTLASAVDDALMGPAGARYVDPDLAARIEIDVLEGTGLNGEAQS